MPIDTQNPQFKTEFWDGKDLLGRGVFAEQLAQRIQTWRGRESMVLGLFGEWGNGKTVTKEMVLQKLRTDKISCPLILEFNPWEWSGHEQLTTALFKQIGATLGKKENGEWAKKIAHVLKQYERYLKVSWEGGAKTLAIISFVTSTSFFISLCFHRSAFSVVTGIAAFLTWILPFVKKGQEFLEWLAATFSDEAANSKKTLAELKSDTRKALQKASNEKPLLIIVDDVDRLSPEEIKSLFQLIKANLNFPNIIYFLIFQKDIIEDALEETLKVGSGREYLKKIIQVGFDLPKIERRRLNAVVKNEINKHISTNGIAIDAERFEALFLNGFVRMFNNLRDFYRFLNAMEFHLGLFRGQAVLEVDWIDLALLEALKQFEERVYQAIPLVKNQLLRQSDNIMAKDDDKDKDYREAFQKLVDIGSEENRLCLKEVLSELFPPSHEVTNLNQDKWFREFRICDADSFDRYFLLAVPMGAITNDEVNKIISAAGSVSELSKIFEQYYSEQRLYDALRYIAASIERIKNEDRVSFFTALFNIGDHLEVKNERGWFTTNTGDISERIIRAVLSRESSDARRAELLLEAIQKTTGVYLPVNVVRVEIARRARHPEYARLPESTLPELKKACLERIGDWAKLNQGHYQFSYILAAWKAWGTDEISKWIENFISTEDGLLHFLRAFLGQIELNSPFTDEHLRPAMTFMESFVTSAKVGERIDAFKLTGSTEHSVAVFQEGLRLVKASKSDRQISPLP